MLAMQLAPFSVPPFVVTARWAVGYPYGLCQDHWHGHTYEQVPELVAGQQFHVVSHVMHDNDSFSVVLWRHDITVACIIAKVVVSPLNSS